jgi:DNA adenine methylase
VTTTALGPILPPDLAISPTPFIKWAGGKQQLLEQFERFFPRQISRYIEPFVGSGAVFFHLWSRFSGMDAALCDINADLIATYEVIRDTPVKLMNLLESLRLRHSIKQYLSVRSQEVKGLNKLQAAARFIYLNKTCWNGLYRVNLKGQFNVPMGSYKNPRVYAPENLLAASSALQNVTLRVAQFRECLDVARTGDFLYFDPPYQPLSATSSFTAYTKEAFGEKQQAELASVVRELHRRGCLVMLSNSDTDYTRSLYSSPGLRIQTVLARRAINSKGNKRGAIPEIVVTNY